MLGERHEEGNWAQKSTGLCSEHDFDHMARRAWLQAVTRWSVCVEIRA